LDLASSCRNLPHYKAKAGGRSADRTRAAASADAACLLLGSLYLY